MLYNQHDNFVTRIKQLHYYMSVKISGVGLKMEYKQYSTVSSLILWIHLNVVVYSGDRFIYFDCFISIKWYNWEVRLWCCSTGQVTLAIYKSVLLPFGLISALMTFIVKRNRFSLSAGIFLMFTVYQCWITIENSASTLIHSQMPAEKMVRLSVILFQQKVCI